jgi:hypothetical protein
MSIFDLSRVGDSINGCAMWAFKKFCGKGLNQSFTDTRFQIGEKD